MATSTGNLLQLAHTIRQFKPDEIVAPVLVFRAVYYLLPLSMAVALFTAHEIAIRRESLLRLLGRAKTSRPESHHSAPPQPPAS